MSSVFLSGPGDLLFQGRSEFDRHTVIVGTISNVQRCFMLGGISSKLRVIPLIRLLLPLER
jgi:hypothetical protein